MTEASKKVLLVGGIGAVASAQAALTEAAGSAVAEVAADSLSGRVSSHLAGTGDVKSACTTTSGKKGASSKSTGSVAAERGASGSALGARAGLTDDSSNIGESDDENSGAEVQAVPTCTDLAVPACTNSH